ncbi:MAG: response regulator [Chamaesiphon sp.]|nr:response regulator [Chamaesiphon sp.]
MNNDLHYSTTVDLQRNSIGRLHYLSWGEFTGTVDIAVASGQAWEIVFYQGQIVWSLDLIQPNQLWQRLLSTHCGSVGLEALVQAANCQAWDGLEQKRKTSWYYQGALSLIASGKINSSQLTAMLTTAAQETIFDLLQYGQGQKLSFRSQPEIFINRPPILVNTEEVISQAELEWADWEKQKLANISPNKIPVIRHPVQLYRQTTPIIYQNLVQVITGKRTFREIAIEIDEDLLLLTRSLTRYIQTGIVELIELPDLKLPKIGNKVLPDRPDQLLSAPNPRFSFREAPPTQSTKAKLVICIDDSSQVCELMRSIVTDAGYRFISIQDSTQALPRLLENKPDLIFLDLVMPKVNGYEVCGQIGRISSLAKTPIVILTSKDGLLDRLRSKVVGASEFICKPITKAVIDSSLNRYLGCLVDN